MGAPLALIFGEALLGGILLDHGVKDVKASLGGASSSSTPAGNTSGTPLSGVPGQKSGTGGTVGDQKAFGAALAADTGLSPTFIESWLLHEQPAGSPSAPGSNNWLNIGAINSNPADWTPEYYDISAMSPQAAAQATANWMRTNQPGIIATAGQSLSSQVEALIDSGWASSHYGYESPSVFLSNVGL
jgi:hypothetical protein